MEWLNYHHLLYFWTVAREGSISRACKQLHLAQPTISAQLRKLEESIGEKLFERSGRNLVLTDTGQLVYGYADEIFSLGREMADAIKGRPRVVDELFAGRYHRYSAGLRSAMKDLLR